MRTDKIIEQVENYKNFFTLEEIDKRAFELANKYNFKIKTVGKSENNHPIYLIKAGNGEKKAFIWGFPHPNEPIGSMSIDFLINFFGKNKDILKELGFTWYFIYSIDPDGMKLNETWFKNVSLKNLFLNFYRPSSDRMVDWTFPIKYKNYKWKKPMKETKILMKVINNIKPDLMYPLHNSTYGGAYFFCNKKFSNKYYKRMIKLIKKLKIPLHLGEGEEEFVEEIIPPFFYEFGLKDYYTHEVKLKHNPLKTLNHGDNSSAYLVRVNPNAVSITGEVPYFYDKEIENSKISKKTRKEVWLEMLDKSDKNLKFFSKIVLLCLKKLDKNNPFYYVLKGIEKDIEHGNNNIRKYIMSSNKFKRNAKYSEIFDCTIGFNIYNTLKLGQIRRAAIESNIDQYLIKDIENKIEENYTYIIKNSNLKPLPIKNLVQLQIGYLFETLKEI
ncbi:MAG TPA: M14 family zinc carboxypeptidase [Candidatus Paceibacterota bacterium]|nr:M14 family zinc carboxypeptidase [Candidatus Paceibacterota bacterium]